MSWSERDRALRKAIIEIVTDPDSVEHYEALVEFNRGAIREKVWLPVTGIDEIGDEVRLLRNGQIKIFPFLTPGEPMRLGIYELEKLRKVEQ